MILVILEINNPAQTPFHTPYPDVMDKHLRPHTRGIHMAESRNEEGIQCHRWRTQILVIRSHVSGLKSSPTGGHLQQDPPADKIKKHTVALDSYMV